MDIVVEPTEYVVSAIPEDHIDFDMFAIKVCRRAPGRWAVLLRTRCLDADGGWDWEPIPSERTDEWKAAHRFDLDTALRLACEAAPKVTVNGWSVEAVLAEEVAR